jgi:hypothetical protein
MFQTNVVEKIQTHILCSITFLRKSCRVWNNMEKYGRIGQATDGTIIWHMGLARWITKATGTHSDYVIYTGPPPQQTLRESLSVLHLYVHCLSCSNMFRHSSLSGGNIYGFTAFIYDRPFGKKKTVGWKDRWTFVYDFCVMYRYITLLSYLTNSDFDENS